MGRASGIKGLISLIEAAGKVGAHSLKYKDLEVDFVGKKQETSPVFVPTQNVEAGSEVHEDDEKAVKMQQLDELLLSDPETYEKLQLGEDIGIAGEE